MTSGALLIVLAVSSVTLGAVASLRRSGIPAPVVLVIGGLIIGFLPFVPDASLNPKVVLLGLLPLLIYDAAATSSPTAILRNARSIGALAVPLVAATAFAVAATAHWVGHLSWPIAFVLGTAVGPTDAAAATSIARRIGLPRRLIATIEGEALFNDATALVLYAAAVAAATTGHFSPVHTAGALVYSSAAGCAIGLAVGLIGRLLRNRIDDPPVEIAASILLAYAAYIPAQAIHASGVLAAVAAGLYLGWHSSSGAYSARTRLQSAAFWETLVFLVNAVLFVFVGLSFHTFTAHARGPVDRLALTAGAVIAIVIIVRVAWTWALPTLAERGPAGNAADRAGRGERLVLGWSGMRGTITLAALLAVPTATVAGRPLAGRDDIVYIGFAVIVTTLVVQGMTLPLLVRHLKLSEHPTVADAERRARITLVTATLEHLDRVRVDRGLSDELADGLRAQYQARMRHLESASEDDEESAAAYGTGAAAALDLRHEINALQRDTLIRLRESGRIGTTILRRLERELDLQEAAMPGVPLTRRS
jgi:monovalent cation/hydrogen antiporter